MASQSGGDYNSLAIQNVSALPKRDNGQFISTYIREQRQYRNIYSTEGKAVIYSWELCETKSGHETELSTSSQHEKLDDFLLDTPILRARRPKSCDNHVSPSRQITKSLPTQYQTSSKNSEKQDTSLSQRNEASKPANAGANITTHSVKKQKKVKDSTTSKAPQVAHSKKRSVHEAMDTDQDKENRLEKRRQRKKAKKDIIKPKSRDGRETKEERNSKKKKDKNETKAQARFALMHGFSATNVGKNRLTLESRTVSHHTGVFKKGKASDLTNVIKNFAKKKNDCFEESEFLHAKRQKMATRSRSNSQSDSSVKSQSSLCRTQNKYIKTAEKKSVIGSQHIPEEQHSELASSKQEEARAPYNPDDSIVWDIEKDIILSHARVQSHLEHGSIVVSFPQGEKCLKKRIGDDVRGSSDPVASAVSLGPSESASQVATKNKMPSLNKTSSYFQQPLKQISQRSQALSIITPPAESVEAGPFVTENRGIPANQNQNIYFSRSNVSLQVFHDGVDQAETVTSPQGLGTSPPSNFWIAKNIGATNEASFWSELNWGDQEAAAAESNNYGLDSFGMKKPFHTDLGVKDALIHEILPSWEENAFSECHWEPGLLFNSHEDYDDLGAPLSTEPQALCDFSSAEFAIQTVHPSPLHESSPGHADNYLDLPATKDGLDSICEESNADIDSDATASVLYDDPVEHEHSAHIENFYQGRMLLYGVDSFSYHNRLANVEAEVAGLLSQNHWLPQKL